MTLEQILVIILIGAAAGWLGSFVGCWILRELKVSIGSSPLVNAILTGAIGAFVILFVVSLFTGKS